MYVTLQKDALCLFLVLLIYSVPQLYFILLLKKINFDTDYRLFHIFITSI